MVDLSWHGVHGSACSCMVAVGTFDGSHAGVGEKGLGSMQVSTELAQEQVCVSTESPRAIVVGGLSYETAEWLGDRGCSVTVAACGLSVVALPGPLYRAIVEDGAHHWEKLIAFFDEDGEECGILDIVWDIDACETRVSVRAE